MRLIIHGAGGVGGVIGAQLFRHGQDVALIARGPHFEALRGKGLRYDTPHGSETLAIPAYSHPREIDFRPGDVVLLTMKSQHTRAALEDLRAAAGDEIPVICAQNGVANEREALRRFAHVYAMLVVLPAESLEPGVAQTHALDTIGILDAGVYPRGVDATITAVCAALGRSGFSARPDDHVMRLKYAKLVINLGNSLQAICRREAGDEERRRQIAITARQEAQACFAAAGIDHASRQEERARRGDLISYGEIDGKGRGGGSSWQSLMRRTGNVEADYLNGEIVQLGRLHNVETPVNWVLQRLANELAGARGEAQSIPLGTIERLIADAKANTPA